MELNKYFSDNLIRAQGVRGGAGLEKGARDWQEGLLPLKPLLPGRVRVSHWKAVGFGVFLWVGFLAIFGTLFRLQIIEGRRNRVLAESNSVFAQRIPAPRGVIYDREGKVLVRNRPEFVVELLGTQLPKDSQERNQYLRDVAGFLKIDFQKLEEMVRQSEAWPYRSLEIKSGLTQAQQIRVKANLGKYPGLVVRERVVRDYLVDKYFSHVLGYVGKITRQELRQREFADYPLDSWVGKAGLEKEYEGKLRGEDGQRLVRVTASGELQRVQEIREPRPGRDLYTTLDRDLQEFAGRKLEEAVNRYRATGGAFIALQPGTGEILSLVSLPAFKSDVFVRGEEEELREIFVDQRGLLINRAIAGLYPPGSTIKPAVGAAALQEGIIDATTQISDWPQIIRIGQWQFPDWTVSWGAGAHGYLNVQQAIAESCDVFFYKVGGGYPPEGEAQDPRSRQVVGLGAGRLAAYLREFGLGERTGIDLPGEEAGLVPTPEWKAQSLREPWFLGDTYHLSIGQGFLLATPLQILDLTNIIATRGKRVVPRLNRDLPVKEDGRRFRVETKNLEVVREGMRLAVSEGIVYPLRNSVVAVAAKTGTAEFGRLNEKGEWETHAWVAGFAPYDEPQISFVLFLEGGGKSENAAKVANEIINWYFRRSQSGKSS